MVKRASLILAMCLIFTSGFAQKKNKEKKKNKEEVKTGWNFGFLPIVTYNTDLGLQYGALTNMYHYGDGKIYPGYYHSIYAEVSRYTKGSGIYRVFYDSKHFIKGIRTTFDVAYLPDLALDFYGFNGAQAEFNKNWQDDEHLDYKTRMFYKHERNMFRTKFDFQGKTAIKNINWAAGISLNEVQISTVDTTKLNKGKTGSEKLPSVPTLYDHYINWGIIKEDEKNGGFLTTLKAGIVYDSRDNEPNPMKGLWSEIVLAQTLNPDYNFLKIAITHRQYFTLVEKNLSFAYRVGYQNVIAGKVPFYALPTMIYSYLPSSNSDGLGGSKTIRGVVRNRVVGEGSVYGNLELRWKFTHFRMFNQNIYLALCPFTDFGQVVHTKKIDKSLIPNDPNRDDFVDQSEYFNEGKDILHITYGGGFHFAMNQNFIISADYGMPIYKQDGNGSIYIGMNFLF